MCIDHNGILKEVAEMGERFLSLKLTRTLKTSMDNLACQSKVSFIMLEVFVLCSISMNLISYFRR